MTANTNKWWIETFGNVSRYIQERNASVLTVVSTGATNITLRLTNSLDNTIFNYPVTLRRPMPGGWAAAAVTQNGASVSNQVVNGSLTFDVVPNGGDIVLSKLEKATSLSKNLNTLNTNSYPNMNSIKPKKFGSNSRLLGALRSFLAMLTGVLALFKLQAYAASTTVSVNFGSTLSSMPAYGLGVGCSVYDYGMTASGSAPAVANSGAMAIRYPGGSFADIYHWQTGTACNGAYVAPGTDFDTFMNNLVNPAGAKAIITCDYGSDPTCSTGASPSEAAAWVQYANVTKGYGIKYWEIGNEQAGNGYYGSSFQWEEDLHADKSPMAYGRNVAAFSSAMKAYDPTIKIGASVVQPGVWPDTDASHPYNKCVLTNCASAVDFVIIHWYPDGPAAQSLQSPTQIPGVASSMRSELNSYVGARASSVEILVTETGPYTNTGPAAALFTSDTYLAWIENGIQNVDFQELHQGFLAEGISGVADHAPIWGAYGCRMARNLASVGDTFVTASSGTTMVGVHAVRKTNGHYGVMLINRDPTNSYTITVNASGATLASSGTRYDFGAANFGSSIYPSSGPTQSTITGIGSSSFSITIPAYTMSVVDIPAANVPPVAPANLVATPADSAVQLSWNGSAGADSYIVKRSTTSGSGYTNIATGVTATSYHWTPDWPTARPTITWSPQPMFTAPALIPRKPAPRPAWSQTSLSTRWEPSTGTAKRFSKPRVIP